MFTQPETQVVQWQDLKVKSEVDIVFDIAHEKGWKDCEVFGRGDMITEPVESKDWKLIPADQYEYSIPAAGVDRVLQLINAGIRIQGVIIADDQRRTVPAPVEVKALPPPAETTASVEPARINQLAEIKVPQPGVKAVASLIGIAALWLIFFAGVVAFPTIFIVGGFLLFLLAAGTEFDPKLIILVDDGNGGTVWVSLLTWYD